jgi:lipopolysaccharide export LptBFGC system permease protein LptF
VLIPVMVLLVVPSEYTLSCPVVVPKVTRVVMVAPLGTLIVFVMATLSSELVTMLASGSSVPLLVVVFVMLTLTTGADTGVVAFITSGSESAMLLVFLEICIAVGVGS